MNALTLVLDEADMANFVKASSNDNLFSIPMSELSQFADKAALQEWFEENAYGCGGGDLSDYYTKAQTDAVVDAAVSGKANSADVYTKAQVDAAISTATSGKADSSDVYTKSEANTLLAGKQDTLTAGSGISIANDVISVTGGGGSVTVDPALNSGSTNAVANSAITTVILDDEYVTAQALTELKLKKLDASAYTRVTVDQTINTASTNAISNAAVGNALNAKGDSLTMDATSTALNYMQIRLRRGSTPLSTTRVDLGDHLVYGGSGGSTTLSVSGLVASTSITSLVTISQADYDALVQAGTVDHSVLYIISNALNS